jgi:hypothetical protein
MQLMKFRQFPFRQGESVTFVKRHGLHDASSKLVQIVYLSNEHTLRASQFRAHTEYILAQLEYAGISSVVLMF